MLTDVPHVVPADRQLEHTPLRQVPPQQSAFAPQLRPTAPQLVLQTRAEPADVLWQYGALPQHDAELEHVVPWQESGWQVPAEQLNPLQQSEALPHASP